MIGWRRVRALVVLSAIAAACSGEQRIDDLFTEQEWAYLETFRLDQLDPIRCTGDTRRCDELARFGQRLFFDPSYAGPITVANDGANGGFGAIGETGKVSCDSCHDPAHYFADHRLANAQSLGTAWTKRNVPGLVDLAYRESFIWSGKYDRLEDVLDLALTSPAALNSTHDRFVDVILERYLATYNALFVPVSPVMVSAEIRKQIYLNGALAIATYESRLVSGPAPFDRYLAGDKHAIERAAKRGAQLFIGKALCSECHDGPLFADDRFHVTGVEQRGDHAPAIDRGRFDVTGDPIDEGRFRTPTLRHIAETAPYMHAGQHDSLGEVIEFYRWGGDAGGFTGRKDPRIVPLELTDDQVGDLVAFLRSLTGAPVDPTWTTKPRM